MKEGRGSGKWRLAEEGYSSSSLRPSHHFLLSFLLIFMNKGRYSLSVEAREKVGPSIVGVERIKVGKRGQRQRCQREGQ